MMKKLFSPKIIAALLAVNLLGGCQGLFQEPDIRNNPNVVTDVDVTTLLAGTLLGTAFLHEDTDVRIASLWAGEINGLSRAHQGYA